MKISIAMATYNGSQYLKNQLESFLDQTRKPDELIITDDCSTDRTENIVREFEKKAPFKVKFYRNEKNLGYCGNFNAALMKTTGDLVFLSDQDDVWYPDKIKTIVKLADYNYESWLFMNDAELTDANLKSVGVTKLEQVRNAGLGDERFVTGCCCAVRRKLLNLVLPIPALFKSHDNWLVWFADGLQRRHIHDVVLQKYRRHGDNESDALTNRISKVSTLQRYARTIQLALSAESEFKSNENIEQLAVFLHGVQKLSHSLDSTDNQKLKSLSEKIEKNISIQKKRIALRQASLPERSAKAFRLLCDGEYQSKPRIFSFLRDVLG